MSLNWFIHHLRFSLLGLSRQPSDLEVLWRELGWEEPHRKVNHARKQITEWTTCDTKWVDMVRVADQRVDVFQHANVPGTAQFGRFTDLRPCSKRIEDFSKQVSGLAGLLAGDGVERVALGGQLWLSGETAGVCMKTLNGFLTHVEVPPGSEQFMYRINHPLEISGGGALNRMTTWSVITRRHIFFQPDGTQKQSEDHAAQLAFDFSNRLEPGTEDLLDAIAVENLLKIATDAIINVTTDGEPDT